MAVNLSPIGNDAPFLDASGNPLSGGLLYTYVAGSAGSTAATTYTTSLGNVQNANPIVLNSNGYPASGGSVVEIWLTGGVSYLFVLKTSAGVTVWSRDNISGINDVSSSFDQWIAGPAPTFISATSFSIVGDQTGTFQVGRRIKTTNSGGTVYSTILTSAFGAVTTVTVVNDSGSIDSGLSAVSYGLLSASNVSKPPFTEVVALGSVSGTNTITASATVAAQGYVTNQCYVFIPANTNTGATTLNINSLGAKNVFWNGAACVGGEIRQNVPVVLQYDGTQLNIVGPGLPAATQANQETATSVVTVVTPGRQQFHPSAAKGWVEAGTTGNALASYNVSSVTDTGVGVQTTNWSVSFSSTNYCVVGGVNTTYTATAAGAMCVNLDTILVGSIIVNIDRFSDGNRADPSVSSNIAAFGDQ